MEISLGLIKGRLNLPGKSKTGLAKAMRVNNSAISALLKGDRQIKASELPAIIEYLELQNVPIMGRIGAGANIDPDFEQVPPEGLEVVNIPVFIPDEMIAFQVNGDSMHPRYDDGDVIVVWKEQKRPLEYFYGKEAAVRTTEGRRYLKIITRGKGRLVNLISHNAKQPIENVKLAWIGEVYITLRAYQVVRLGLNNAGTVAK